ncbi:MAG: pantetheine-phosphate adenylyltransferase [Hyphomicrobiaceae bacterium]|nr:pantetheine-phosphate adenylyltransferase [Hyphomicrobiaceae bacterium]
MRTALFTGSFDPPTNGHFDVIRQAFAVADRVVVGIGVHPGKVPLFSFEERVEMLRAGIDASDASQGVLECVAFEDLAVDCARRVGAGVIVRGLRDGTDFDYEMQMAGMNGAMAPEVATVFLPASPGVRHITATLVRQIAKLGGDISGFVPAHVAERLIARFARS